MIDLQITPTKYHILFDMDNDWNKGNESKMNSLERCRFNQLYLEYNRWELQRRLKFDGSNCELEVLYEGFVKEENNKQEIQGFIH